VIPVTQTRTGEPDGNCFAASLASVFETAIPEFDLPGTDYWANVDRWLARRGYRYVQRPITDPAPRGWHLIEGLSPRGGQHAVVGYNGRMVHDPHPQDGTGRGLVRPERWGVLERVGAHDAAPLSGKRLNAAAKTLLVKHDELRNNPARYAGGYESRYRATRQPVVDLVKDAGTLLDKARLDDDLDYWRAKLRSADESLRAAERLAAVGDYGRAVAYLDCAFSLAHTVIDKMRTSGRARDMVPVCECEADNHGHEPAACLAKESRKYIVVGTRQNLCPDCADKAAKHFPGRVQAVDTKDRRARLHRALDAVLNASGTPICPVCNHSNVGCVCGAKDGGLTTKRGLTYDHPRIVALSNKIRALEDKGVPYDDPRVQKLEAEIRRLEGNR
jgi:hypothetical protein